MYWIGRRTVLVNLDPANESRQEPNWTIDVRTLIPLEDVMQSSNLGPNGALLHAMDYLYQHIDWLFGQIDTFQNAYFLFDCPGIKHIPLICSSTLHVHLYIVHRIHV